MAEIAVKRQRGFVGPSTPSAEPFRTLRLALQLRSDQERGNVVLFTSAEAGEGKSTVAVNYALLSALGEASVLLVDGDLRKPTLHELLAAPRSPGLVEVLAGTAELQKAVSPVDAGGRLTLLPAGTPVPGASDLAYSGRMADLLRRVSEEYDLVVIDSPPLLGATDGVGIAAQEGVDVVLVVKRPRRRVVRKAVRKLQLIEATVAGLVVNREGRLTAYRY